MNEITRIRTSAPPATRMAPREIDQVRAALRGPAAIEVAKIISEIRDHRYMAVNEWVAETERVVFSQRLVALVAKAEIDHRQHGIRRSDPRAQVRGAACDYLADQRRDRRAHRLLPDAGRRERVHGVRNRGGRQRLRRRFCSVRLCACCRMS